MKEQKVGLTTTNWILSILGIIVLSCLIILPPVFRAFLKEEVVIEESPKVEIKIGTTTCQNENVSAVDYTDNETIIFTDHNDKIQNVTKNTIRTYFEPSFYQEQKPTYGKLVTAFSIINGYEYSAIPDDDTSSVNIQEKYDLAVFKPTTIKIPGDENPTAITTAYQLNDDISTIKEYLTANGYTCSETEKVLEEETQ